MLPVTRSGCPRFDRCQGSPGLSLPGSAACICTLMGLFRERKTQKPGMPLSHLPTESLGPFFTHWFAGRDMPRLWDPVTSPPKDCVSLHGMLDIPQARDMGWKYPVHRFVVALFAVRPHRVHYRLPTSLIPPLRTRAASPSIVLGQLGHDTPSPAQLHV